jgi:TfoX N-terminal domain
MNAVWCAPAPKYDPIVAYDEDLAARIRELVSARAGVTEKKMFGGLAFLIRGNMAVGVSGQGGILVRVDPEESDVLVADTPAQLMEMRGRGMRGWLRVNSDDVAGDAELAEWVGRGTAYARSLPAKE